VNRCRICGHLTDQGEACTLCLPLIVAPRNPSAGGQLLAERYDLSALGREAFPQGAAP
jgi:hypothetical protein